MIKMYKALCFALQGISYTWNNERAFKQEVALSLILIPIAYKITDNLEAFMVLIGSLLFVMIIELLNTAIEKAVDRVGTESHELSKIAKDCGAAATLLAIVLCTLIWIPKLYSYSITISFF
ncbi:MAG: diacylglycerol kinase [Alphaproteobacteria bacterium]|nr:diacylglycerol kinase [Alphaproteobacteria bacterium]